MDKFLAFFLATVVLLVCSFGVYCFADDPVDVREHEREVLEDVPPLAQSRSTVRIYADEVYLLKNNWWTGYSSSFRFDFAGECGTVSGSGFTSHGSFDSVRFTISASNYYCTSYLNNANAITLSRYVNSELTNFYPYVFVSSDVDVDSSFLNYFVLVEDFGTHTILSSASDIFVGALGIGSTLIAFIADNWIAIIPLVLWVLIALFGVFRKLFKGV